jgi:hypothetical protein
MTTNFAMPGFGTILAGRKVGYLQIAVTAAGFALTIIPGIPAVMWGLSNISRMQESEDPMANLREMWVHMRWPILGIVFFIVAMIWAWFSSMSILAEARKAELLRPQPPKINPG